MAEIAPFRGLRYNPDRVPNLTEVFIPPYDVISPRQQEQFGAMSPYNMVHLELGKTTPEDSGENNAHTRAEARLAEWRREGVLIREDRPAVYYYELDYTLEGRIPGTRYGFICVLRLEDFAGGSVRPHERTFQAVKDERLGLMTACKANLSPVFAVYPDDVRCVDEILRAGREPRAIAAFSDLEGMRHRVWRVSAPDVLSAATAAMKGKPIFIADGHHRYETALTYSSIQRRLFPAASPRASFNYIMVYLSDMNQEGLKILPTHRLLRGLGAWNPERFLKEAEEFFTISRYDANKSEEMKWRQDLEKANSGDDTAIGFCCRELDAFYLLKGKPEIIGSHLCGLGIPKILHKLVVVVLDHIVLRRLMGLPETFLADEKNIHFKHLFEETVQGVHSGSFDAAFLINPTHMEHVREVASAGLTMPHKSTYFYPKAGSGIIINPLSAVEEIVL